MDTYNNYPNQGQVPHENLEDMYPEIYMQIHPIVVKVANEIRRGGFLVTHDVLDTYVDNAIKMSCMWDEDGDSEPSCDEAYPVQAGFGRQPFRRRRRGFHNRNTLRDIFRILLLRELLR